MFNQAYLVVHYITQKPQHIPYEMDKITIYYVDDDKDDLQYFAEATSHLNIEVVLYNVGFDMLQAIATPPYPAILFLDLNMPEITGFEILKFIKNNSSYKDLPIVILSTSSSVRDIDVSWELGASLFIIKTGKYIEVQKSLEYVIGIDWNTFKRDSDTFVYKDR